jgi:hypothetical protein
MVYSILEPSSAIASFSGTIPIDDHYSWRLKAILDPTEKKAKVSQKAVDMVGKRA